MQVKLWYSILIDRRGWFLQFSYRGYKFIHRIWVYIFIIISTVLVAGTKSYNNFFIYWIEVDDSLTTTVLQVRNGKYSKSKISMYLSQWLMIQQNNSTENTAQISINCPGNDAAANNDKFGIQPGASYIKPFKWWGRSKLLSAECQFSLFLPPSKKIVA